jgi:hypothetical protein
MGGVGVGDDEVRGCGSRRWKIAKSAGVDCSRATRPTLPRLVAGHRHPDGRFLSRRQGTGSGMASRGASFGMTIPGGGWTPVADARMCRTAGRQGRRRPRRRTLRLPSRECADCESDPVPCRPPAGANEFAATLARRQVIHRRDPPEVPHRLLRPGAAPFQDQRRFPQPERAVGASERRACVRSTLAHRGCRIPQPGGGR